MKLGRKVEVTWSQITQLKFTMMDIFPMLDLPQFINIKERKDQAKYMLYRIEVSGSTAVLSEITSNIKESFATSAELKSFVEKYMGVSFFYGEELTLFKK